MTKRIQSFLLPLLFSVLISLPIILPYFHPGYFPTHDGEWAVVRLGDMFRSLRDHQFPVRYSTTLNFEYGYPLFNFAYPFPYYLGVALHFFHFSFVNSIKLLFAISVPFSVFFMYLLSRDFWKSNWAGILSAVVYAYLPYRLVDLFVRGSIGESLSFVLFPLLFYVIYRIAQKPKPLQVIIGALSIGTLITTHNIMSVYGLPLGILFMLFFYKTNKLVLRPYLIMLFLGVGTAGFFWIPALAEKHLILLSQIPIADRNLYFVTLSDLILPKWGYGLPTQPDGFGYQIGIPQILLFLMALVLSSISVVSQKKKHENNLILLLLGSAIICMVFLMFPISHILWQMPILKEINYPWTLLLPIGFLMSFLAGSLPTRGTMYRTAAVLIAIVAIVIFLPHAKPEKYIDRGDGYYLTNEATTTSSHEYMPLWVKQVPFQRPQDKLNVISGTAILLQSSSKKIVASVQADKKTSLRINTIYYPGWKVYEDGTATEIRYMNSQGVMEVDVPKGNHIIEARFGETNTRLLADIVSLVSLVLLCIIPLPFARRIIIKK